MINIIFMKKEHTEDYFIVVTIREILRPGIKHCSNCQDWLTLKMKLQMGVNI